MNPDGAQELAASTRALVVLPAGCGKTEMLARLVAASPGRQLVLTHTHAGIRTLRGRLATHGTSQSAARVATIAAWALEYARAHAVLGGFAAGRLDAMPSFDAAYQAATKIVSRPLGKRILRATYAGVAVDEYQDCSRAQHALIEALAAALPCRVVGDPMQSIFFFGSNDPVPWQVVEKTFPKLEVPLEPRRWATTNPALGSWLLNARTSLERGQAVRLDERVKGLQWVGADDRVARIKSCREALKRVGKNESLLVLGQFPRICHELARMLGGGFVSVDEQERTDLNAWARKIHASDGDGRARLLVSLAKQCKNGIPDSVGRIPIHGLPRVSASTRGSVRLLHEVKETNTPMALLRAHQALHEEGRFTFRRQLWREGGQLLRAWSEDPQRDPVQIARQLTSQEKFRAGRVYGSLIVSRTLLAKGLEFDHVVVTGAGELDAENLYVALSRARRELTVLSPSAVLQPKRSATQARPRQGTLPL